MTLTPLQVKRVRQTYRKSPKYIREVFSTVPVVWEHNLPLAAFANALSFYEMAKILTFFIGVPRLHRTDIPLTEGVVFDERLNLPTFKRLFKAVYGVPIRSDLIKKAEKIETIEEKFHAGRLREADMPPTIINILEFAIGYSDFVYSIARFKPFGNIYQLKGIGKTLGRRTSRKILKELGFSVKPRKVYKAAFAWLVVRGEEAD